MATCSSELRTRYAQTKRISSRQLNMVCLKSRWKMDTCCHLSLWVLHLIQSCSMYSHHHCQETLSPAWCHLPPFGQVLFDVDQLKNNQNINVEKVDNDDQGLKSQGHQRTMLDQALLDGPICFFFWIFLAICLKHGKT